MDYKLLDLINLLRCELKGDVSHERISGLAPFFQAKEDSVTFASDEKFLKKLNETKAKAIIVPTGIELPEIGKIYLRVSENPRILMPKLMAFFKREIKPVQKMIEDSAKIGTGCEIGQNVYIGHDTFIGNNVKIMPNVSICQGVEIGDNSLIYPGVVIREFCKIGREAIIQPG
ncbi:MAG: LpxD N-terminal domain-containing protein, partial [Fusobacteriaceae bacterium]